MYQALLRRDPGYEGVFVVGVKTTAIFCRPTCAAKKPRRENVEFFASPSEALHAGYRPCLRCRPMDRVQAPPEWVGRLMNEVERQPTVRFTDAQVRALAIEPARARRYFKQHYGMTFHAYHRARRMGLALVEVRQQKAQLNGHATKLRNRVDQVGSQHGYRSVSGFRDAFTRLFGQPPGKAGRNGTASLLARWLDTPLGAMLALANDDGLHLLEFVDRRGLERELELLRRRTRAVIVPGDHRHLDSIADELSRYFDGSLRQFKTPIAMIGSAFQQQVWRRLLKIPSGSTLSYAQLASDIGHPGAQRAVGRANGDNRLALIIPCHRVVCSDGTLCGYGGGLWRKKWLLEHERTRDRP